MASNQYQSVATSSKQFQAVANDQLSLTTIHDFSTAQ